MIEKESNQRKGSGRSELGIIGAVSIRVNRVIEIVEELWLQEVTRSRVCSLE